MTVSVYTLRIREEPDDTEGTEVRIVAASLTEAVARAEMRFGAGRILGIEQADGPPRPGDDVGDEASIDVPAAPIADSDFIVAQAPEPLPDLDEYTSDARAATAAMAYVHPAADASTTSPIHDTVIDHGATDEDPAGPLAFEVADSDRVPAALDGPWRPSVLLWSGAAAGLVAFVMWVNFGDAPRDKFVRASTEATTAAPGLPIEGEAPAGGVIRATGVSLRPGRADEDIAAVVGQTMSGVPDESGGSSEIIYDEGDVDDDTVQAIGTVVGEMFARWPDEDPTHDVPAPAPPPLPTASTPSWPQDEAPLREPALIRRWYIEVQRADRVTETLSVNATSAEHARAMVYDRPDHPVIVNGPSTELTW